MSNTLINEQDALRIFLNGPINHEGVTYFSGLIAGLRDARETTARNLDTGNKIVGKSHGMWLGAIGYMAVLNQIANAVRPKGVTLVSTVPICKALEAFAGVPEPERDALYALRCAFAHDYSLSNNKTRRSLIHHFSVTQGLGAVVTLPARPWDGNYATFAPDNVTAINLEAFGDLVEQIVTHLKDMASRGELEIALDDGPDEMFRRYLFAT